MSQMSTCAEAGGSSVLLLAQSMKRVSSDFSEWYKKTTAVP